MSASATTIELEPLALTPAEAAPYPSVSKRSPEGKIEARKRPTTRRRCPAAALPRCRVRLRNRGTDTPTGRSRT
jgi:hypothetical protein